MVGSYCVAAEEAFDLAERRMAVATEMRRSREVMAMTVLKRAILFGLNLRIHGGARVDWER